MMNENCDDPDVSLDSVENDVEIFHFNQLSPIALVVSESIFENSDYSLPEGPNLLLSTLSEFSEISTPGVILIFTSNRIILFLRTITSKHQHKTSI